jgi:tRNA (guanine-N7-)-methyltransferase
VAEALIKPNTPSSENGRSYVLYGRRKGRRLRVQKSALMETLLPRLEIAHGAESLDLTALFPGKKEIWLEVGFGGGEHLAHYAKENPDIGFIGCEPFVNGVASLLEHIDREKLENIRIYADDARDILDRLPDAGISRCFVMFADPWPKKRHADRRFIGPLNLPKLLRILKPGAELRFASDDPVLKAWMLEHARSFAGLRAMAGTEDGQWPEKPQNWPKTRYEQKGLRLGRIPAYFSFNRD